MHSLSIGKDQLMGILSMQDPHELKSLAARAGITREQYVGNKVYFRGIIEFSNICEKDCYYCGVRKGNINVNRYIMGGDEILDCAKWAFANGYGSVVLQSGESTSRGFIDFVIKLVKEIKR